MAPLGGRRLCERPARFLSTACICLAALAYLIIFILPREAPRTSYPVYLDLTRLEEKISCVQPKYEMYPSKRFHTFFRNIKRPKCSGTNWVNIEGGVFRITEFAKKEFGKNITCDYIPIVRGKRDFEQYLGPNVSNIQDGTKVSSVASKVTCSAGKQRYDNYHLTIPYDGRRNRLQSRAVRRELPDGALGMNVLMFGFDSTSRMTWQRKLPKSYAYMMDVLQCIVLEGYNIVADGTLGALLPILTGKREEELPDVAKGHKAAGTMDDFPWIWKDYKKAGYVTQWIEDFAREATFNWRMKGLKKQPMDYHAFDFYAEAETKFKHFSPFCLGSELRHNVQINWITDFLKVYENRRTFVFGFHGQCTHNDNKPLNIIDDDLKAWLQYIYTGGFLDNTVLILMSDHGVRFHGIRETVQGRQEERNPFFSFRLPDWFKQKHPQAFKNLRTNSKRLVTPFDIHATFHHILNFSNVTVGNASERGISLFSKIPASRTCASAQIVPHWCNCLTWHPINVSSLAIKNASKAFIDLANSLTKSLRKKCHLLAIENIKESVAFTPEKELLQKRTNDVILYHLTLSTKPGGGHFEVTVRHQLETNSFTVERSDVSRVNPFGSAADCIVHEHPDLAWFCPCKNVPGKRYGGVLRGRSTENG